MTPYTHEKCLQCSCFSLCLLGIPSLFVVPLDTIVWMIWRGWRKDVHLFHRSLPLREDEGGCRSEEDDAGGKAGADVRRECVFVSCSGGRGVNS